MSRYVIPPAMRPLYEGSRYAPAMRAGDFLFLAGQLGRDEAFNVIADPEAQFRRAWENVRTVLREAGGDLADIVDVVTFHVGLQQHLALYKRVKDEVLGALTPPWTAIGVVELSRPGLLLEIKCTAWLPR